MNTVTEAPPHDLRYQLNAAAIDTAAGIIRGATVAQAGVEALGKFVMVDAAGKITRDATLSKKRLQVVTDETTLSTLLEAAKEAGGVLKVRSDHDDSLSARAGFADNFRRIENRVVADLHLNESYRDRGTVLETAQTTPRLIGLSIDFAPTFELKDGQALMRVGELYACDIVDSGAITHDGLFLCRGVDTPERDVSKNPFSTMAEKNPDKSVDVLSEILGAVQGLGAGHKQLSDGLTAMNSKVDGCMTKVDGCMAAIEAMAGGKASASKESETLAAVKSDLGALKDSIATMQKERAALGLKDTSKEAAATKGNPEPDASERAAKEKQPKDFLSLVREKKAEGKMSAPECNQAVMRENPEAYRLHLQAKGVITKVS